MSKKLSKEEENQIKNMAPPEGKAIVYIIRSKNVGKFVKFHVSANDTPLGYTKGKTFLYTILEPGMYTFVSKGENTRNIDINVEPNQIYYLLQKVRMGAVKARVDMIFTDENEGRRRLSKCKLMIPK